MTTDIETEELSRGAVWLRRLAKIFGALALLLVVVYFVGTSSTFIKGVVVPRIGDSLHAKISVEEAAVSPFSQVILRKLSVATTGPEPLVTAEEIRARYSLLSILRGNIEVQELTLVSPVIKINQTHDGKSNLDPFLSDGQLKPRPKSKETPSLDLHNISLKGAVINLTKKDAIGSTQVTELSNFDLSLEDRKSVV